MFRRLFIRALGLVAVLAGLVSQASAQTDQRPGVVVPRLEVGVSVAFTQRLDVPTGLRDWTGPGLSVAVNGNVSPHVALAADATTFFDGRISLLAGARLTTGFYYGNNRDPVPGRFVGRVLAGSIAVGGTTSHFGVQLGGGADVVFKRPRGLGAHWEVGYRVVPSGARRQGAGYAEIGVIVGPHLR